ncbi:radical SAM protein [Candidatus Fermentibacterales bacterium]|nr:radical SAM protein [Candidatus Fermentibacterales bacterium]
MVTGRCNLSCPHCSVLSHGELPGELDLAGWRSVFESLAELRVLQVTVTGGEPLMREDFPELWRMLSRMPFRLYLNTNATLLSERSAEALAESLPRLDCVMTSLDGPDSSTHDAIRGDGAFSKAMSGTGRLRDLGVPFGFYCTVVTLNRDRLEETVELARQSGARWIRLNYFVEAGPGSESGLAIPLRERREIGRQVLRLARARPGFVTGTALRMEEYALEVEAGGGRPRGLPCGAGLDRLVILPDGSVAPCDHIPHVILGHILRDSLEDILSGIAAREFRAIVEARSAAREGPCAECAWFDVCQPGCPVQWFAAAPVCDQVFGAPRLDCLKSYIEGGRQGE